MQVNKLKKLFFKYFMSYFIIILLFSFFHFKMIAKNLLTGQENNQQNKISRTKFYLDSIFDSCDSIFGNYSSNENIINFSTLDKKELEDNFYQAYKLIQSCKGIITTNNYVKNVFIVFKNNDYVLHNNRSLRELDLFYQDNIDLKDKSIDDFYEIIFNKDNYKHQIISNLNGSENFLYYRPIAIDLYGYSAVAVVEVDSSEIKKVLSGGNQSDNIYQITDGQDNILFEFDTIDNPNCYVKFSETSNVCDLGYNLFVDKTKLNVRLSYLTSLNFYILLFLFLVNFVLSVIFAKKYSAPVYDLILDNDHLSLENLEQRISLKQTYINKWLSGNIISDQEFANASKFLNMPDDLKCFCTCLIEVNPRNPFFLTIQDDVVENFNVKKIISDLSVDILVSDISESRAVIVFYSKESKDNLVLYIKNLLDQIQTALDQNSLDHYIITVGNIVEHFSDLSISYNHAHELMLQSLYNEKKIQVTFYDYSIGEKINYDYSTALETKLMNFVHSGDKVQVNKILNDLIIDNITVKKISLNMLKLLLIDIYGTYVKTYKNLAVAIQIEKPESLKVNVDRINKNELILEFYKLVEKFNYLCNLIEKNHQTSNSTIIEDMKNHINDNYDNTNYGLLNLSDEFNLTENYICQLFTRHCEQSFHSYLQKVRMQKCTDLLLNTSLSIKEIQVKVGYNSSNTFIKAFKRVHGISASRFRELHS